jgi:hypothetical protein
VSVRVWQARDGITPFLYLQKCASSSIELRLRQKYGSGTSRNVPLGEYEGPLAVMWRNPAERLESAYRMFQERPEMGKTRDSALPRADKMPFPDWVTRVLKIPDEDRDLHIASMSRQSSTDGVFRPTKVYLWDFEQLEADYGVEFDVRNASDHRIPTPWPYGQARDHHLAYEADWEVWYEHAYRD